MPRLYVIAYSKDRPFQLAQALKSTIDHVSAQEVRVVVIFSLLGLDHCAPAYEQVAESLPHVTFIEEKQNAFLSQLRAVVEAVEAEDAILWLVDDLLFYKDFDAK